MSLNLCYIFVAIVVFCLCAVQLVRLRGNKRIHELVSVQPVAADYNWRTTKIAQYRPFKPIYREVMNVSRISHEDWLVIDENYEDITNQHQKAIEAHPDITCQVTDSPESKAAVEELYDFVMETLIQRYPQYFVDNGKAVVNKLKGRELPRKGALSGLPPKDLLRILCENTEEDFFTLQFDEETEEYRMRGCSGVSSTKHLTWVSKMNKNMTEIHKPVPGYKEHLKFSMNKYFRKMQVGQWVQRITWFMEVTDTPYEEFSWRPTPEVHEEITDFDKQIFTRVTRQIVTRLPKTKFLAFTQKTYFYPVSQIKAEGYGDVLAGNIQTMPRDTGEYRGRPHWGESVLKYLHT